MVLRRSLLLCVLAAGCAAGDQEGGAAVPLGDAAPVDTSADVGQVDASGDAPLADAFELDVPAPTDSSGIDPDAACATATATAKTELLPVDIIWMVDNSASMAPAVAEVKAGLNNFAALIGAKSLDYKVIMLSIRSKTSPITVAGGTRYPVCIPPPLAGDADCGNGPRFFQSNVDIKSTQPLEQFLGTLDQTDGYKLGQERGGEPWKAQLRPKASRTIVVVTDDNSRFTASAFETFPGGKNPFNTLTLPPGILDASRAGLFDGYLFAGLYGWGSEADSLTKCKYPDGTSPPASGDTYTTLIKKTGGPRAKLCDGKAAWAPFFDAVATAVAKTAKLSCDLAIPVPTSGSLDPTAVNVQITGATTTLVPKVSGAAACGTGLGWYYDSELSPTKITLCPAACDLANAAVGAGKVGKIDVLFGCKSVIK